MNKHKLRLSLTISVFMLSSIFFVPRALAEEITVTGNGAESVNHVDSNSSPQTNVQQNNNANVTNDVKSDANTGNNSASSNTGGNNTINTGNASSNTNVSTSANENKATVNNCNNCNGESSVTVSGNGAFSNNNVNTLNNNSTTVNQTNNAYVSNTVTTNANTGNNSANFNTDGDVSIRTGDITVKNKIINGPINVSKASVSGISTPAEDILKIIGNGAFSTNNVDSISDDSVHINVNNYADIINNLKSFLETGGNDANFNTGGSVNIATGDVFSETTISNLANISEVDVTCECQKEKPAAAPIEIAAAPAAAVSEEAPSAPAAPEEVLAAAAENLLPVTGNNWFFFALIANVLMMLLGAYLRLHSGRSPNLTIAV